MPSRRVLPLLLHACVLVSLIRLNEAAGPQDLHRALTKQPRAHFRGADFTSTAQTLNRHLLATSGLSTAPCSSLTLFEVINVKRTLLHARDPALEELYKASLDGRRLGTFGSFTSDHATLETLWGEALR